MSLTRLVITAVTIEKRPKSEVARDYEVSRRWVQKLVARYEEEGEAAFEPRSRRPRFSPRQLDEQLEGEIVTLRKSLADQGLDAGAATIAYHLAKVGAPHLVRRRSGGCAPGEALSDPSRTRPEELVCQVRRRPAERALAGRRHPRALEKRRPTSAAAAPSPSGRYQKVGIGGPVKCRPIGGHAPL